MRNDEGEPRAFAALTEKGVSNVALQAGTNVRKFNDVNLGGEGIEYDQNTGYLTLQPGLYRINGWSLTTFGWQLTPAQYAAMYSAPGYAFLWNVAEKKIEILGSMQDPMLSNTSIVVGVLRVPKAGQYFLAHQNGNKVAFISMQLFDPSLKLPDGSTSTSHAFAQMLVERM
jgi:hypothetical protein